MRKYYEVTITETGRNTLKDNASIFNIDKNIFGALEEVRDSIIARYGKVPKKRESNKIYIDTKEGLKEIGFLHSFWNRDISHNSKNWYQTDWVEINEITAIPVLIR